MSADQAAGSALGPSAAAWLVAIASGAVLTLEILSLRLLAPYVGLTLQTSTAVIGFALAAIAAGAWTGGWVADALPPQRLLGPVTAIAGALVLFVAPVVRWVGNRVDAADASVVLLIAALSVFPPALLLSAVTPMVVKLRLGSLEETGTVVGRLSGLATLGALIATFGTGFVLIAEMPTGSILLVLGLLLVVIGTWLTIRLRGVRAVVEPLVIAAVGVIAAVSSSATCDVETAYHCAQVVRDVERPTGRLLELDTLSHSYVDLADPTYLEFSYIRAIASVVDEMLPQEDLRTLHLGGGGMSFPRYLKATRSNAENLVLEIDEGVVDLNFGRLGASAAAVGDVRVQDARVGLSAQRSNSRDLVVGDAFSGLTVPWHLTTRETVADVRRVLEDEGVYVLNVIDYPPLRFARAEIATLVEVFENVAVIARPGVLSGNDGGNLVLVASDGALPEAAVEAELSERAPELELMTDADEINDFAGGAQILTDDFAPVDQLHTPYTQAP